MEKKDLIEIIESISAGLINNKIDSNLYSDIVESLIRCNLDQVPELEEFSDFLAQHHSPKDAPELFGDEELKSEVKKVFNLEVN